MTVEGRDEHGRCAWGHLCCIREAPGHDDPHELPPARCGWCNVYDNARGVTSPRDPRP